MIKLICEDVTYGKVGNEAILTNKKGNTLKLDEQAIMLWDMLMNGYSKNELTEYFTNLYPQQQEMVRKDIEEFFRILCEENMIVLGATE